MGSRWRCLAAAAALSAYFYIFMEWLFFLTKPSFMSVLGTWSALLVLFLTPLPVAITSGALVGGFWAASLPIRSSLYREVWLGIARIIPVLVLSSSVLLLTDNFTSTLFRFGIHSAKEASRSVYAFLFLVLSGLIYWSVWRFEKRVLNRHWLHWTAVGLLGLSLLAGTLMSGSSGWMQGEGSRTGSGLSRLPNILLLSSDGLDAERMSAYGYERDTTPFLRGFVREALLCENAFSNAAHTGASIASLLTGKLPTETRLIYPPDILRGRDAYQHLPLILRNYGYRSLHLSIRHYADAYDLNMRESFDSANFREGVEFQASRFMSGIVGQESAYFLGTGDGGCLCRGGPCQRWIQA